MFDYNSMLTEDINDNLFNNGYPSYVSFSSTTRTPNLRPGSPGLRPSSGESGQYQCRGNEDCHEHGSCQYDQSSRKYKCKCKKWYEGDGWSSCVPASNAGCNILNNCHSDAECLYTEANDEFFCRLVRILQGVPKKTLQKFKIKVKSFECFWGHPVNDKSFYQLATET